MRYPLMVWRLASLGALLAGVASNALAANSDHPGTLVWAQAAQPSTLDPAEAYDEVSQNVLSAIYDTLLAPDKQTANPSAIVPRIARRVPSKKNGLLSDNGLVYRFPIRGVRFHDGSLLTPLDVRYSLLRMILLGSTNGPASALLRPILGIEKPESRDIENALAAVSVKGNDVLIRLKKPFAPFLSLLTNSGRIVSKDWCIKHGEWDLNPATWQRFAQRPPEDSYLRDHSNGTGPFKLKEWKHDKGTVLLARNPVYWRGSPAFRNVVFTSVIDASARARMLQRGDADIIGITGSYPKGSLANLKNSPGIRLIHVPLLAVNPVFFFNLRPRPQADSAAWGSGKLDGKGIPPGFFSDTDIRQGFANAFDAEKFLAKAPGAPAATIIHAAIPPGLLGYDPQAPYYPYDPQAAALHFKRAFSGKLWETGFQLTVTWFGDDPQGAAACDVLAKSLARINPKFKLKGAAAPYDQILQAGQRFPLWLSGWIADSPDPDSLVFGLYDSKAPHPSEQGYHNPLMDHLIEEAAQKADSLARAGLYHQIQKLAYEDVPNLLTVGPPAATYAVSARIKGWEYAIGPFGIDLNSLFDAGDILLARLKTPPGAGGTSDAIYQNRSYLEILLLSPVVPERNKERLAAAFLDAYWKAPALDLKTAATLEPYVSARKPSRRSPRPAAAGASGIQWVSVPGGSFMMGTDSSNPLFDDAHPAHQATLPSFYMSKTLVTNRQYKVCVAAGACTAARDFGPTFDGEDQPVVGVDWSQAAAFAKWAGGRLPSETEWEYAARSAGKNGEYPWGSEKADCDRAAVGGCGLKATAPVCSKPAGNTAQGLCDMAGDVWEWTEDRYHDSYKGAPAGGGAWVEPAGSLRVVRGGSWANAPSLACPVVRYYGVPGDQDNGLGFRVVRTARPGQSIWKPVVN